jgi:hypothetical protein
VTTIKYKEQDENKLSSCEDLRKNNAFKYSSTNKSGYCESCGAPIIFKLFELVEIQHPHDFLSWKRVQIKKWWTAFNADQPNQKHEHSQKKHLLGVAV